MFGQRRKLIDKKLVHKKYEKNVFLFNLRRKFPNFFEKELFESLLKELSKEERMLLSDNYRLVESDRILFADCKSSSLYLIKSILPVLFSEQIDCIKNFRPNDTEFILGLYKPDEKEQKYFLTKDLSEEEEKHVLEILNDKEHFISDGLKAEMAEIFERSDLITKGNVIYANMHINLAHDFFFEHTNEHVPGMMIMETFRQFVVAVNHVFGKVPVDDAQLILECLDSRFFKYTELALPITLKGYIKECKWYKHGYWSYLDIETDIIQQYKIVAHFRLYGQIISSKIFKRMRRTEREKNLKNHRFIVLPEFKNYYFLRKNNNEYLDVNLMNISFDGFMLHAEYFKTEDLENKQFNFEFLLNETDVIYGKCEKIWQNPQSRTAGFHITEINDNDFQVLKDSIVKYCHVYEKREIS